MKVIKIIYIVTLVYWLLATIELIDIMNGDRMLFAWNGTLLMPGYLLGFAFGFGGGNRMAMVGQTIPLVFIAASYVILKKIITYKNNDV